MKSFKRILSCVLAGACILYPTSSMNTLPEVSAVEETAEITVWDGTYDTAWYDAEVSEMHINTAEELAGLAQLVNNGKSMEGQTIILDSDIILNDTLNFENWGEETPENQWVSIGTGTNSFKGTFNGNGHTISGMYQNEIKSYGGLFGYVRGGIINNINCEYGYIYWKDNWYCMGGICGFVYEGTVTSCSFSGLVTGVYGGNSSGMCQIGGVCGSTYQGIFIDCSNYSTVSYIYPVSGGSAPYVGGICGYAQYGEFICCDNYGLISSKASQMRMGGICGYMKKSNINNCCNKGLIVAGSSKVGGICGYASEYVIQNCYNSGEINGLAYSSGILGYHEYVSSGISVISDSYNIGDITGGENVGAILGYIESGDTIATSCCYYLSSTALKGVGYGTDNTIAKNQTNMQTEAFAESLGDAFVYVEGDYPKLFWELGYPLLGDINSDYMVTVADAVALQKHLLNSQPLSQEQGTAADINKDKIVDVFDMILLRGKLIS